MGLCLQALSLGFQQSRDGRLRDPLRGGWGGLTGLLVVSGDCPRIRNWGIRSRSGGVPAPAPAPAAAAAAFVLVLVLVLVAVLVALLGFRWEMGVQVTTGMAVRVSMRGGGGGAAAAPFRKVETP